MGTRCTITVEYGKTKLNFYRHWDGYVSETGKELSHLLLGHKHLDLFIKAIINQNREPYHLDVNRPQYELLDCDVSKVSDAEYRYYFKSKEGEQGLDFSIKVENRKFTKDFNDTWVTLFDERGKKDEVSKNFLHFCRVEWDKAQARMIKFYQNQEVA